MPEARLTERNRAEQAVQNKMVSPGDMKVKPVGINRNEGADLNKDNNNDKADDIMLSPSRSTPRPTSRFIAVSACCAYVGASMAMTLVNKHVVSGIKFPGPNFLLLAEVIICTIMLTFGRGIQSFKNAANPEIMKFLFVCTLAKAGNMYFSFLSMKYTSLPVYNVLKRMNPVCALIIDSLVRNKKYSKMAIVGLLLIAVGAAITGGGDLEFNFLGYSVAILACMCQASYLVLSARALDNLPDVSHVDVLYYTGLYNCILFLPLMIPELPEIQTFVENSEHSGWVLVAFVIFFSLQGTMLNYVTFWCTSVNSPVTTGVAGNAKGVLTTAFAVAVYGSKLTTVGWGGLVLNSCGGLVYTMANALEKTKKHKTQ